MPKIASCKLKTKHWSQYFRSLHIPRVSKQNIQTYYFCYQQRAPQSTKKDEPKERKGAAVQLSPTSYTACRIEAIWQDTHNVKRYRVALPRSDLPLDLPVSSAVKFRGFEKANNAEIVRSYTPVNDPTLIGAADFVVKLYPNGLMSNYLRDLQVNDTIDITGPFLKIPIPRAFLGKSQIVMICGGYLFFFFLTSKYVYIYVYVRYVYKYIRIYVYIHFPSFHIPLFLKKIFTGPLSLKKKKFIGTGLAPMVQTLKEICRLLTSPNDEERGDACEIVRGINEIALINCNKSEQDIICMSDLQSIESTFASVLSLADQQRNRGNIKFHCSHVLETVGKCSPSNLTGQGQKSHKVLHVGLLNTSLLKNTLPPPNDRVLILVCGSANMLTHVCGNTERDPQTRRKIQGEVGGILKELGYKPNMVYKF
ncbi:NADH-cytochrome b5 reductase [Reticulomyxa filosa]|uniref:cytochrome-b5 reductase n=1 Tax=Reticulomyxa filosa TaxID=46433 RepID=X6LLW1_RETFI|nr:NADH-cytochrome b5 reductase [Reticulomyxa filosa]|eukprot:ETO02137.1 NADH-cytochrome b5 reductase [Reticulomyxa filosa]